MSSLMRCVAVAILLASLPVHAAVFKCVDPRTGKVTFTDMACKQEVSGKKVAVQTTNFNHKSVRRSRSAKNRAWVSQDPERNTEPVKCRSTGVSGAGVQGHDSAFSADHRACSGS